MLSIKKMEQWPTLATRWLCWTRQLSCQLTEGFEKQQPSSCRSRIGNNWSTLTDVYMMWLNYMWTMACFLRSHFCNVLSQIHTPALPTLERLRHEVGCESLTLGDKSHGAVQRGLSLKRAYQSQVKARPAAHIWTPQMGGSEKGRSQVLSGQPVCLHL